MPTAGDELHGPGLTLLIDRLEPEILEMEVSYQGSGELPPEHLHPSQAERFRVLEGRMRTIIDGSEVVYDEGATFDVPVATTHQMAADGPTRVRWEVRPALRTAEFFERLYSGRVDQNFLNEFAAEIRFT
jgi:quercetin dioxygenase-like cupin family protein